MKVLLFNCLLLLALANDPRCAKDPLDSLCPETIFLWPDSKPLDPKAARLCDRKIHPIYENHTLTECEEDTTCTECRDSEKQHYKMISKGFENSKVANKRENDMKQISRQIGQGYIFIVMVTSDTIDSFNKLICSMEKSLNIDPVKILFVITLNKDVDRDLRNRGFVTFRTDWLVYSQSYAKSRNYDFTLIQKYKHRSLYNIQTHLIRELLELNYKVITIDVKTIFRKGKVPVYPKTGDIEYLDFFEYLNRCLDRRDLLSMSYSDIDSKRGFFHVGFSIFKPTFYTLRFVRSMEELLQVKLDDEQEFFNTILRHYRMQQLTKRVLSPVLFEYLRIEDKNLKKDRSETVLTTFEAKELDNSLLNCN